ncbi:MAG TPA: hypothetical protein VKD69_02810 [Vicinamibacterales bacterium]|nr:hypothetical protein [Vicinamibacterales bacterium]
MKTRSASSRSAARAGANASPTANARKKARTTAARLDALFDSRSDEIDQYADWEQARRPGRQVQRVNVDFPVDLLRAIDAEARRLGVTRQAFIKIRIADTLPTRGESLDVVGTTGGKATTSTRRP